MRREVIEAWAEEGASLTKAGVVPGRGLFVSDVPVDIRGALRPAIERQHQEEADRRIRIALEGNPHQPQHAEYRLNFLNRKPPGFVYLMACGEFVKIGIARDVARRHADLTNATPFEINVLCFRQVGAAYLLRAEKLCHAALLDQRVKREWFSTERPLAMAIVLRSAREIAREHAADRAALRRDPR